MTDTFRKEYNACEKLNECALQIKNVAEELEIQIKKIGMSREVSLALTNLEQSIMWAIKALHIFYDINDNE